MMTLSWYVAIFASAIPFALSVGVGLFVLCAGGSAWVRNARLSPAELFVLAFALGAVNVAVWTAILSPWVRNATLLFIVTSIIAGVGLYGWGGLLRHLAPPKFILVGAAAAAITWWLTFAVYSSYPFTDLFAEVHTLKAANEYYATNILNPYIFQYVEFRSPLLGGLKTVLPVDLVQLQWPFRYFMICVHLIAIYAFIDRLLPETRKLPGFLIVGLGSTTSLLTNGSLTVDLSLVLIGLLYGQAADMTTPATWSLSFPLIIPLLLTFLIPYSGFLIISVDVFLLLFTRLLIPRLLSVQGLAVFLIAALICSLHRNAYILIPFAAILWSLCIAIYHGVVPGHRRLIGFLWLLTAFIPLCSALIIVWMSAIEAHIVPALEFDYSFLSPMTELLLGTSISSTDDIALGLGVRNAVIESGRAVGPLFVLIFGGLAAWWWARRTPLILIRGSTAEEEARIKRAMWSILGSGVGLLATLSGLPFVYRLMPLIVALFGVAGTELLHDAIHRIDGRTALAGSAVVTIACLGIYLGSFFPDHGYSRIVDATIIFGIGALIAFFLLGRSFPHAAWMPVLLSGFIGLGLALDRFGITTRLYNYSYGPLPPSAIAITHYTADDLAALKMLAPPYGDMLWLSDPFSLALARAVIGASTVYSFSNLDTVAPPIATAAKTVLSAIVNERGERGVLRTCNHLALLMRNLTLEARFRVDPALHSSWGAFKPQKAAAIAKRSTMFVWPVVVIVNRRTLDWLNTGQGSRLPYYPPEEPLPAEALERLKHGAFPIIASSGNRTILLRVDCPKLLGPNDSSKIFGGIHINIATPSD